MKGGGQAKKAEEANRGSETENRSEGTNRCFDHIADGGGGLGDFTRKRPGSCTSTPIRPRRSHRL